MIFIRIVNGGIIFVNSVLYRLTVLPVDTTLLYLCYYTSYSYSCFRHIELETHHIWNVNISEMLTMLHCLKHIISEMLNPPLHREELMKKYCEGSWDKYNEIISSVPRDDQVIVGNYLPQPETCPAGLTGHFCSTDPGTWVLFSKR